MTRWCRLTLTLSISLVAAAAQASLSDETGWYASGALAAVVSAQGADPTVSPGGIVRIPGSMSLGQGRDLSAAIGREFRHERDGAEPVHTRLELQVRQLTIAREGAALGVLRPVLSDQVNARAWFVDGLVRVYPGEQYRWWAGAGVGMARVQMPGAPAATPGCNCLNPAKGSGAAWQVKVLSERPVTADGALFGELGYVRLPAVASAGAAGAATTAYGRIGAVQLGVGWRGRF